MNIHRTVVILYEKEKPPPSADWGIYITAIVVAAGNFIGLPFYVVYLLENHNLGVIPVLMFFAIKTIPIAKNLLAVLALMPTPMVLATAYSYDVALIGFLSLGIALLVRVIYYPEKKVFSRLCLSVYLCAVICSA